MGRQNIEMMAHLLRRTGFGATREELEGYASRGYEAAVEDLLNPGESGVMPDDLLHRYNPGLSECRKVTPAASHWMYRMLTTRNPLEEKLAFFWHGVFATGWNNLCNGLSLKNQVDMLRTYGLGSLDKLLVELSKDPAMIVWLDNNENHNGAINENYGRELLELFSMGIGNYTEDDIKEAARAFTGWTIGNSEYMSMKAEKDSIWPYSRIVWHFIYREDDHDDGEKTFLGETGRFNGEDIVQIIARQPATARFIARHLYDFFVADEAPVPQWPYTPPKDPDAIETLANAYFEGNHEIRYVLRVLFNSDFFKSSAFARVKGPVELVVGGLRLAGSYLEPDNEIEEVASEQYIMGQGLNHPPTVEGWHEGTEWISSGSLLDRVNFIATELSKVDEPGVRDIIARLASLDGGTLTPEELVDGCLDLVGPLPVSDETRATLVEFAARKGDLVLKGHQTGDEAERRVGDLLRLVVSTREFQLV